MEYSNSYKSLLVQILKYCQQHQINRIFASKRRRLANIFGKRGQVSIVGILNYEGTENQVLTIENLARSLTNRKNKLERRLLHHFNSKSIR